MRSQRPFIGYGASLNGTYYIKENLFISASGGYEGKGSLWKFEITDQFGNSGEELKIRNRIHYLVLPVMVGYVLTLDSKVSFFVNGGIHGGYMMKATTRFPNVDNNETVVSDAANLLEPLDFGISWGGGMRLMIGEQLFALAELRANIGMYDTSCWMPR